MICPACTFDNLPGAEHCTRCMQDLTQLDQPTPYNRVERSLMEDPVSVLRPRPPITVLPTTTVPQAIQVMLGHNLGSLLVVDGSGKLVGIHEREMIAIGVGETLLNRCRARQRQRGALASGGRLHDAPSCSQMLRIRPSRRSTVRSPQPSLAAISSLP